MKQYTIEDIEKCILEMEEESSKRLEDALKGFHTPFLGVRRYRKALFEQSKVEIFRRHFEKAMLGTPEEQQKFINNFIPILLEREQTLPKEEKQPRRK